MSQVVPMGPRVPTLILPSELTAKRPLTALTVSFRVRPAMRSQFGFPGNDIWLDYYDGEERVGKLCGVYAPTSPCDRFYLSGFSTKEELRRRYIGTSMLVDMARRTGVALTPVHVQPHAREFWAHMCDVLPDYGVSMTPRIDQEDFEQEARRWNSLAAVEAHAETAARLKRMALDQLALEA